MLQHGDEQEAGEGRREAAVVQAEAAVQQGNARDEAEVQDTGEDAEIPSL